MGRKLEHLLKVKQTPVSVDIRVNRISAISGHMHRLEGSNQVTLITDKPVHTTQNPEFFSEYEFDSSKF